MFDRYKGEPIRRRGSSRNTMNLAEELIVAGLTGRLCPAVPGQRFAFVSYERRYGSGVEVLGEGPTPFLALMRGVHQLAADGAHESDGPVRREHFDALPEEIRNSGDPALIGFLAHIIRDRYLFGCDSCYLNAKTLAQVLPEARCVFAWDAVPFDLSTFGLYALHPLTFSPDWRTGTAILLAKQMYDSNDFYAMPILADALQDAGCDSDEILDHCRGSVPHDRECWVVNLVLGKEKE